MKYETIQERMGRTIAAFVKDGQINQQRADHLISALASAFCTPGFDQSAHRKAVKAMHAGYDQGQVKP